MTTAALVAAALAAFPAPHCEARVLHYGPAADAEIVAAHGADAAGMGGGSRPCELWIRTGLRRGERVRTAFHEAAHTAGYEHGAAMDRAVRVAVRRFHHPIGNRRTGVGRIVGGAVRGGGTD